jgi:fermentation-respiration switch protein FrsA (DUF1100 family)
MKTLSILAAFALLVLTGGALADHEELTFERYQLGDHDAFLLAPENAVKTDLGKPWVWYAPTFHKRLPEQRAEGWMVQRLHAKGIAVAGIDVGESFGSPNGRAAFQKLYDHMVSQGYSTKPVLLARSRGGLMLYNWAVEHPDSVAGVAGVYPVCNLLSYPGLKKAAPAYEMTEAELKENLAEHNPIDRLAPLAKAKVPVYHIHGDNDKIVPLEDNSTLLATRYKKLGGSATLEVIKGGGHDMEKHWFESQALTDFMIDKALQ